MTTATTETVVKVCALLLLPRISFMCRQRRLAAVGLGRPLRALMASPMAANFDKLSLLFQKSIYFCADI